jgi:2-polyprenyl-6-methoxyphenol hydroxylase and related FAD-dependent oxidoreductases
MTMCAGFFEEEFPDAVSLMPSLLDDFRINPTGSLVTIRCAPWFYRDKACLVGDAAHAVVPFYGQGMNAAFEDCVVLDECLEEFPENRERAFAEYFRRRKENADALPILRSGISSRCETRPRRKHFARKRNWITRWKPRCPEYICRFTRWSLSQECPTQKRRSGRRSRTHWCMQACS